MTIKTIELHSFGDVQGVGYRRAVARIAQKEGLSGFVQNLEDGSVLILAHGDESTLVNFIRQVKIDDPPIKVEEIKSKERTSTGQYRSFKIKYGTLKEEFQELYGGWEDQLRMLNKKFDDFRGDFKEFANRTDQNFNQSHEDFTDYRKEFKEFADRTDQNFNESHTDFTDYRKDFEKYTDDFKEFSTTTGKNFTVMSVKYGEILRRQK